jgi:glutamate 5-kinase
VVPIVNENDTVATDEIRYGDNDRLAAQIAVTVGADQLVLLSDVDGFYSANPKEDPTARSASTWSRRSPPRSRRWRAIRSRACRRAA